jgi:hypothetical protein
MVKDKFGIDQIYVTKSNTSPFFMDNNNLDNQSKIEWGSKTEPEKTSGGYWQMKDNSQVRMNFAAAASYKDTCSLDFARAYKSGSSGMSSPAWKNIEMTIKSKLTEFNPSDGRLILKGPTGRHHSNTVCCSGSCYGVRFFLNTNPMEIQFFKEMWHVNYDDRPKVVTKFSHLDDGDPHNFKFITYNVVKNNKLCQAMEAYIDFDADGSKFVKVGETVDTGGWGDGGDRCNGADDQILTWDNEFAQFRWDADSTDIEFKDASCREIDPFASIDDNPTDPSTGGGGTGSDPRPTTVRLVVPLVLRFDVNARRNLSCIVGTPPPSTDPFYDIDADNVKELSDSSEHAHRKRLCVKIDSTGSPFYNKVVKDFKVWMRKHNSPNTANVQSKIWKSGSGTTIMFTSPTNRPDSLLGASYGLIQFDYTTNTYILKVGDRIGIEYLGTDPDNYVEGSYIDDISGNGTTYDQYEGSSWESKSRELSCQAFE